MQKNNQEILTYIQQNPSCSSKEIHDGIKIQIGYATVKRILTKLRDDNLIVTEGKGRGTKYKINPTYELIRPIDVEGYFKIEIDDREIKENFNLKLIPDTLAEAKLIKSTSPVQVWA